MSGKLPHDVYIVGICEKGTFVINENIAIKAVSEEQDVFGVSEVNVNSGEQVWIEAAGNEQVILETHSTRGAYLECGHNRVTP